MKLQNIFMGIILLFLGLTLNAQALSKAQIKGNLSGAFVTVYQIEDNASKTLMFEETTDAQGLFDAHGAELDVSKFYIYEVSGGVDTNDSTPNNGTLRAIVKGSYAQANDFTVSVVSEMLYIFCAKEVKYNYSVEALQEALDANIKGILEVDVDGNSVVDTNDSLQFEYVADVDKINQFKYPDIESILANSYQNKVNLFAEDVLNTGIVNFNTTGRARGITLSNDGTKAYVADDTSGLQVIDITTPLMPTLLGTFDTTGIAWRVTLSSDGTKAYVADGGSGLQIIDITTPSTPILLGTFDTTGSARGVTLSSDGTKAYVADDTSGLQIIGITNPSTPTLLGTFDTLGNARGLTLSSDGTKAYVADGYGGLYIIDITTPSVPLLLSRLDTKDFAHEVVLSSEDTKAYVANDAGGLQTIDITTASAPTALATVDTTGAALGVILSNDGTKAYVADYASGLQIIDITTPVLPIFLVGTLNTLGGALGVIPSSDDTKAYVANYASGLQIIDITNPTTPSLLGTYNTTGQALGVTLSSDDTKAYVADDANGLLIMDITIPSTPTLLATFDTIGDARDITLSSDGTKAYVADDSSGLLIIDITIPSAPTLLGTFDTAGVALSITISPDDTKAYVADFTAGLQIIDITAPSAPTLLGTFDTTGYARGVTLSSDGTKAYVADSASGLQIIDITNPTAPSLLGTYNTTGQAFGVTLSSDGKLIYVSDLDGGLQIIDITNPSTPFLLRTINTGGNTRQATLSLIDSKIYIVDQAAGLQIIDAEIYNPITDGDNDNDGVRNSEDAFPYDPTETEDTDGDGIGDNTDPDIDNDGVLNDVDVFPYDATETLDNDADGIGDNADTDADGDGISNVDEVANGLDPLDNTDALLDTDSDGVSNIAEITSGTDINDISDHPVIVTDNLIGWSLSDTIVSGEIKKAYIFTVATTGTYIFTTTSDIYAKQMMYDGEYNQVRPLKGTDGHPTSSLHYALTADQTYIFVLNSSGSTSYTINTEYYNAQTIPDIISDLPLINTFTVVDENHEYTFDVNETGLYTFSTTGDLHTQGTLTDRYGRELISDNFDYEGNTYNFKLSYKLIQGQTYTLTVKEYDGHVGEYGLISSFSTIQDIDLDNITTDSDAYSFIVEETGLYSFYSSGNDINTIGTLLDENYKIISYDDDGGDFINFNISHHLIKGHRYTLLVEDYNLATGSYGLHSTSTTSLTVINDISNDLPLSTHTFTTIYDTALYAFTPAQTGEYTLLSTGSLDTVGTLYDSNGTKIAYDNDTGSGTNFGLVLMLEQGETYYLEVKGAGYEVGSYVLDGWFVDVFANAIPIDEYLGSNFGHSVNRPYGNTIYSFTATTTGTYSFYTGYTAVDGYTGSYGSGTLYDANQNVLISVNTISTLFTLEYKLIAGNTYYLGVSSVFSGNDYYVDSYIVATDTDDDGMIDDEDLDDDNDGFTDIEESQAGTDALDENDNPLTVTIMNKITYFINSTGIIGDRNYVDDGTYTGNLLLTSGTELPVEGNYEIEGKVVTLTRSNGVIIVLTYLSTDEGVSSFTTTVNGGEPSDSLLYDNEAERDAAFAAMSNKINPALIMYLLN